MEKLNYGVISLIVDNLKWPLARYAAISRIWLNVVETRTFRYIYVHSEAMDMFDTALGPSQTRRRSIVETLDFRVSLPASNEKRVDYRNNLVFFRQAVTALLQRLAAWDEAAHGGLKLTIKMDPTIRDNTMGLQNQGRRVLASSEYITRSAARRRYLTLRDGGPSTTPTASCIDVFAVEYLWQFKNQPLIHPMVGFLIARCFLSLRDLRLSYHGPARRRRVLRRDHRKAMADGVKSLCNLPQLRKLYITCTGNDDPLNHSFEIQDFGDDQGVDPLCEAIRGLAEAGRLVELRLEGTMVSPDLFQHQGQTPGEPVATSWPSMQHFSVWTEFVAPDGRWYATGDPTASPPGSPRSDWGAPDGGRRSNPDDAEFDSDEISNNDADDWEADDFDNGVKPYHPWRTKPDPEVFNPLALAMATAVLSMPNLKTGSVQLGNFTILECAEDGHSMWRDEARGRRWRMSVPKGADWQPPKELVRKWDAWVGSNGMAGVEFPEDLKAKGYGRVHFDCHGVDVFRLRNPFWAPNED